MYSLPSASSSPAALPPKKEAVEEMASPAFTSSTDSLRLPFLTLDGSTPETLPIANIGGTFYEFATDGKRAHLAQVVGQPPSGRTLKAPAFFSQPHQAVALDLHDLDSLSAEMASGKTGPLYIAVQHPPLILSSPGKLALVMCCIHGEQTAEAHAEKLNGDARRGVLPKSTGFYWWRRDSASAWDMHAPVGEWVGPLAPPV